MSASFSRSHASIFRIPAQQSREGEKHEVLQEGVDRLAATFVVKVVRAKKRKVGEETLQCLHPVHRKRMKRGIPYLVNLTEKLPDSWPANLAG
mmetsp:Transcript_28719/g.52399  ORF Transcript_28719/g.52399 Transcript_28719/m.52399 type:complete len:93 (-) Transcript_28719:36-314(-)